MLSKRQSRRKKNFFKVARNLSLRLSNCQSVDSLERIDATLLYESQATRDARARVKTTSISLAKKGGDRKQGWGVPLAWLVALRCLQFTGLAIKIGLRDLPISFLRGDSFPHRGYCARSGADGCKLHLLPRTRDDYILLAER